MSAGRTIEKLYTLEELDEIRANYANAYTVLNSEMVEAVSDIVDEFLQFVRLQEQFPRNYMGDRE